MIPQLIIRIWMNQRRQRAPINPQPGNEGAELLGREDVDFEHCYGVRTDWSVPDAIDAEFGDCERDGCQYELICTTDYLWEFWSGKGLRVIGIVNLHSLRIRSHSSVANLTSDPSD